MFSILYTYSSSLLDLAQLSKFLIMARAGFSTSVLIQMAINKGFPANSLRSRQQEQSRNGPLEDHSIWLKLITINNYNDNNGPSHCGKVNE